MYYAHVCVQVKVAPTPAANQTSAAATPITAAGMTLENLLQQLKLEAYLTAFEEDGYDEVEDVVNMTLDEIMDIKDMKKGHAKRILRHTSKIKSKSP